MDLKYIKHILYLCKNQLFFNHQYYSLFVVVKTPYIRFIFSNQKNTTYLLGTYVLPIFDIKNKLNVKNNK